MLYSKIHLSIDDKGTNYTLSCVAHEATISLNQFTKLAPKKMFSRCEGPDGHRVTLGTSDPRNNYPGHYTVIYYWRLYNNPSTNIQNLPSYYRVSNFNLGNFLTETEDRTLLRLIWLKGNRGIALALMQLTSRQRQ